MNIARAIENQAYVFAVNRGGRDPNVEYSGGSLVVDPRGRVLAEGGDHETVLTSDVDAREVTRWRAQFPAWRERVQANTGLGVDAAWR